MNKFFKIVFSSLSVLALVTLFACSNKTTKENNNNTTKANDSTTSENLTTGSSKTSGNIEDGLFVNYVEPKDFVATRTETRSPAFTAYTPSGEKIGDYITIADAINSCVDYDVEYNSSISGGEAEVYGSYVTKLNGSFKMFVNHEGFSEGNDDQFWSYENGTSLASYNCWDNTDTVLSLTNTNLIVHKVTGFGTVPQQSWNSYTLLDSFGEEITDVAAQSWELSSTMDAAVLEFPKRLGGISAMKHEIDLSNVSIIPPYDGADSTYAFIGYYAWQDYYVIAIGIACDTRTGNWYPFIGTSRDDSFSDVEYNMGKCVFTSTWSNEGYFTPDVDRIEISIGTKRLYDEEEDEYYQVDEFNLYVDSEARYSIYITDSLLNNYFSGVPLSWENGFVFIAGLDIKNKIVQNNYVEATDYFNGSEFLGLKVTSAQAYVPSKEEISDVTYGFPIEEEWRGKWHDILMANSIDTAEVVDYTILNTCVCASYQKVNGCDLFSFSYNANNTSLSEMGTELRKYQSKIDALANITVQDILNDSTLLDEVGSWLVEAQTIVPQKYFLVLDFTNYYQAKELFESTSMSEEAKAVVAELNALASGDYEGFDTIYTTTFASLDEEEQSIVRLAFGAAKFDNLKGLNEFVKSLSSVTDTFTTFTNIIYVNGNFTYNGDKSKEMTAEEAFAQLTFLASGIANKTRYDQSNAYSGLNDDPNTAGAALMNGDNHFYPSMRIVAIVEFFESIDLELPNYMKDLLTTIGYEDFYTGFYYPIYQTVKLAVSIEINNKTTINDLSDDELEFLNEVWVSTYFISMQINWNWNSGNKLQMFYDARSRAISVLAGGDISKKVADYYDIVGTFLTGCGYEVNYNGWGVTASEIK